MNRTKIEWVKNPDGSQGYTWNPITGCLKGCSYCYARKLANGRLKQRYLANDHITRTPYETRRFGKRYLERESDPFYPRFWPEKLGQIKRGYHRGFRGIRDCEPKARGVFVCDMSDLFGIGIPEEWTRQVLSVINEWGCRNDRFYLLTKQPQNLAKFSPFPDNCWVGVSVTDYAMFQRACSRLDDVRAKVKYISFEPLLSWKSELNIAEAWMQSANINWLIIGSQTKPYRPPEISWVKEIVEAAGRAGVKVFLKDNLKLLIEQSWCEHDLSNMADELWPTGLLLRQEMPA